MRSYLRFLIEHPRFLTFGLLLTFCSSFGQTFFINFFRDHYQAVTGLSDTDYGKLYSGATILSGSLLLWLGARIDRMDLQRYSTAICAGLIGSCLFLSVASAPVYLFFAIFGLRLFGQGLLGHTAATSMTRYLAGARGKAMGIVGLGYPLGEATLPSIAAWMLTVATWREAWQLFAAALLLLLIPLVRVLLRGHRERHAAHVEEIQQPTTATDTQQRQWSARDVLRDMRFYLLLPIVLGPPFISTGIFFNGIPISKEMGWTPGEWAATIIAYAVATIVASLVGGSIADKISPSKLVPLYLIPHALGLIALASGDALIFGFLYMAGAGLSAGANSSFLGALWPELYGVLHLGAIRSILSCAMVYSTGASPFLMGYLTDQNVGTATIAWWFFGYTVVASVLSFIALRLKRS
ncbi:MAG: MFS transporter [Planctomycetota bacterium]